MWTAQEALQVVRDGISRSSAGNTIVRSTVDGNAQVVTTMVGVQFAQ